MKKLNCKGFVIAETLIVSVFLMTIFAMIYANYLPLMAEYEKREVYDDVDGKYGVYWIKKMIEDKEYNLSARLSEDFGYGGQKYTFEKRGYIRFQCSDINSDLVETCKNLVKALEVYNCDKNGDECNIFITKYQLKNKDDPTGVWFKDKIKIDDDNIIPNKGTYKRYMETCPVNNNQLSEANCNKNTLFINDCINPEDECRIRADKKVFSYEFKEYVLTLPNYNTPSPNGAEYRVIVIFHHRKDNNNYYSYATMEVAK